MNRTSKGMQSAVVLGLLMIGLICARADQHAYEGETGLGTFRITFDSDNFVAMPYNGVTEYFDASASWVYTEKASGDIVNFLGVYFYAYNDYGFFNPFDGFGIATLNNNHATERFINIGTTTPNTAFMSGFTVTDLLTALDGFSQLPGRSSTIRLVESAPAVNTSFDAFAPATIPEPRASIFLAGIAVLAAMRYRRNRAVNTHEPNQT